MKLPRFLTDGMAVVVIALGMMVAPGRVLAQQRPMGTDVYSGTGTINWTTVKNDGVSFAWAKAAEGTATDGYIGEDSKFTLNETNAKAAGVLIGAYYFARPSADPNITGASSADSEAQFFWSVASNYVVAGGGYLVPMLDWEDPYVTNVPSLTETVMSEWLNEWCNDVSNYAHANGVTIKPVVYTGTWYSEPGAYPGLNTTVTKWPSWLADYPECTGDKCGSSCPQTCAPASTYPWSTWNIWQYGDTNWSGGDSDVFNGTTNQFVQLFVVSVTNALPSYAPAGATIYWDASAKQASPGSGGTGNWDTSTADWWFSGPSNVIWSPSGDYAVFAGTVGTVTVGSSPTADGITFNTAGYNITGSGTLVLSGTTPVISVPAGSPTYLGCVLGGSGYEVTGGGVLVLENAGNYCGSGSSAEYVNGPNTTLVVDTDHDTGNDGVPLNLENGGIYQDNDTTSGDQFLLTGCTIGLGTGGGIFNNPNASLTMTNKITGTGSLTFTGYTNSGGTPYILTLTNAANSYSGGTIVNGLGELKASASGTLGSTTASLTVNGGILDLGGVSHTVGVVTITGGKIQDGTLTGSSYTGSSGTVSAVLAGSGAMTQTGSGIMTLSGANTYTGITTISGGLLQVSADDNLGAAPGSAVTNKLTLNNTGISSGLRCTTSFTLNANRGITLVSPNGGSVQTVTGQTATYPNIITGNGNLGIGSSPSTGYGTNLFTANNTYKGTTTIAAGTLRLGVNGALPAGTPLTINADNNTGANGGFDLNGFSQTIGPLAGSTASGTDTPTIKLTGALTVLQTNINTTFPGVITGSGGGLTISGNSALTLSGTNTYTGNTTISLGTLALAGTGSISNSATISIASGATFDVSAIASYALSSSTTLSASGTSAGLGAATIKGGTTVSLGSRPIILTYDGSHPALIISQGALSLNGNAFTVNGSQLAVGAYTLIQQTSGNIASSGSYTVSGTAIGAAGTAAAISVSGGSVILAISDIVPVTITGVTLLTNGTVQLNFTGTPGGLYLIEGTTNLTPPINWTNISTNMADSNGMFNFTDGNATNYNSQYYRTAVQ